MRVVPSAFSVKVAAITIVIVALALVGVGGLGYLKFSDTYDDLIVARLKSTAAQLSAPVKTSLTLGLKLGEMDNLSDLVQREAATDSRILSLEIADASGQVLYASRPEKIGETVTKLPMTLLEDKIDDPISQEVSGQLLILAPLRNSFDELVGAVILRYSLDARDQARRTVMVRIVEGAAFLLLTLAITVPFVTAWVMAGFEAQVRGVLAVLRAAFDPTPTGDPAVMRDRLASFAVMPFTMPEDAGELGHDGAVILTGLREVAARAAMEPTPALEKR